MTNNILENPTEEIRIAIPKGRIMEEAVKVLKVFGITPEAEFFDEKSRKLSFASNLPNLTIIRVRSFDVATFVTTKAADFAICGLDVLREFNYKNIFNLYNLGIGKCRLSLAANADLDLGQIASHIKIATKYPNLSKDYFRQKGLQCEIIKLNGAIELAANLNLCDAIVDLVSTGETLKENDLVEKDIIMPIQSQLIVNRNSFYANLSFFRTIINKLENDYFIENK